MVPSGTNGARRFRHGRSASLNPVLEVGDRYAHERLGITFEVLGVPAQDGTLELRLLLEPGRGRAIAHLHDDFVERFDVEAGTARARLRGRRRTLVAGETLEVPRGAVHVNPFNASDGERLVVRQTLAPATPFVLCFFETLGEMMRAGRVDRRGQLPLVGAAAVAHATDSQTF